MTVFAVDFEGFTNVGDDVAGGPVSGFQDWNWEGGGVERLISISLITI